MNLQQPAKPHTAGPAAMHSQNAKPMPGAQTMAPFYRVPSLPVPGHTAWSLTP